MAKTKVSEWDVDSALNTDINNIDINTGCSPANINAAIREVMAQIKDLQGGYTSDTMPVASGGTGATTAEQARINLGIVSQFVRGMVVMWSGTISNIPSGFLLCDGTLDTPDLRNRFVIGADADSSGVAKTTVTGAASQTGGTKDAIVVTHTHASTGITDTVGDHVHSIPNIGSPDGGNFVTLGSDWSYPSTMDTEPAGGHVHNVTNTVSTVGSDGTNQNLVPYYALAYIMKS